MEKRVLVVDDEVSIVEGLTTYLQLESIDAMGAFDCDGALTQLQQLYFPVVLADLRLRSEEEGLRLIDAIRTRTPQTRVVVLTGYATPEIEEDLLSRGATMILHKPTPTLVIVEAVQALLAEMEEQAGDGEIVDAEALYLSMRQKLYSIPRRRYGLSHQAAEDVLHEAWLLFLSRRGMVRAAAPWLAGTAANLSKQHLDRIIRKRETNDETTFETMCDEREGTLPDVLAVRDALDRVDERTRTLCSLIGMQGLSYEEVSAATGLPLGSIGPMYIRAKKRMRDVLAN